MGDQVNKKSVMISPLGQVKIIVGEKKKRGRKR